MNNDKILKKAKEIQALIDTIAAELKASMYARAIRDPFMIGIHTGGVWLARRLHDLLEIEAPLGTLDISFYRDDFTRIGMNPEVHPSNLPVAVEDRHIILVDDVVHTGRTIRAALNEIFDYGRPASVELVALVERQGHELPIRADIVGIRPELKQGEHVTLTGPDPLELYLGSKPNRESRQDKQRTDDA